MSDLQSFPELVDPDCFDLAVFGCALRHSSRDGAWVRVSGELDLAGARELEQRLDQALGGARLAVLDLRQLTFMDSAGIHVILRGHDLALRSGGRLLLVRGRAQVNRLLDLTGLTERLEIVDLQPIAAQGLAAGNG